MEREQPLQLKTKNGYSHLVELGYSIGQLLTILFVPQKGPNKIMKKLFGFPHFIYKIGLGNLIGSKLLLLTTVGRKSGKLRTAPLGYIAGANGECYIIAGWKGSTNWYKNLKATPEVQVQTGSKRFGCQAKELSVEDQIQILQRYSRLYPNVIRTYEQMTGMMFDGSEDFFQRVAEEGPMIALRPNPA